MVGVSKMVGKTPENEKLKSLGDQLDELSKPEESQEESVVTKDIVLFFSFDVVNSTSYKTINYYGWAQVLNLLFKELRKQVQNLINGSEMWRVLGDEAIFIVKIRDEETLRAIVDNIFKILITTIHKLKKGQFFQFSEDKQNFNLMRLQNILSLKASAWIAAVNNVGDVSNDVIIESDIDNIFERYHSQEGYEIFEFLGNDIDAGFRISKETQDSRLVLSYELAYLISQRTESLSYLHIITYRKLKGVWKDKLYPIIWYHNPHHFLDYYKKEIALEDSFTFDACDESDLIKEYYDNRNLNIADKVIKDRRMYTEVYYALNKIKQDRDLAEKIVKLQELIKSAIKDTTKYINVELLQMHCAAVCYVVDDHDIKILVAKRKNSREKLPGKWEFGCSKATTDKSIAEKVIEDYKEDFNIDIQPVLDDSRAQKEPKPIALYQIESKQIADTKWHKGIIILAQIKGKFEPSKFKPTKKHDELKWVEKGDLDTLDEKFKDTVPDFKQTLSDAFELIKNLEGI